MEKEGPGGPSFSMPFARWPSLGLELVAEPPHGDQEPRR